MPNAYSPTEHPPSEGPRFWDQLLELVDDGRVVPIVGHDLLTLAVDGQPVDLYRYLAQRLAEYLEVSGEDLPAAGALHEVACRYLASTDGKILDLYPALKRVFPTRDRYGLPAPLLQLAAIRPFNLFVTSTFDPLLAEAVNQVRFGGEERTGIFSHSLTEIVDLQPPETMRWPAVFHLLGRLSAIPDFAITEEDTLELVHSLQANARKLEHLFGELARRHLLLIGSSFPDWLARFVLRITKGERLWMVSGKTDVVADARMREDTSLVFFLRRFSVQTQFYSGGASEFVAELHRRWTERHPPQLVPAVPSTASPASTEQDMERGAVFLSYASEDLAVVETLYKELERAGVDVWFDRHRLEVGDPFEEKIRRNINRCSLFVPILSRHTLTPERRFFRIEWDEAQRVAAQVKPSMRFILPVAVDDVPPDDEGLPPRFRQLDWHRLAHGDSLPALVTILRDLFRDYQRSLAEEP